MRRRTPNSGGSPTTSPQTLDRVRKLAARVHAGELAGAGGPFAHLLVIGIGGSALGPQFVARALGHPATDRLRPWFFDNTDPDAAHWKVLAELAASAPDGALKTALGRTVCLVISKSDGTPETANGMRRSRTPTARPVCRSRAMPWPLPCGEHAGQDRGRRRVAGRVSDVGLGGGRTSETSVVGLLPAALQGVDIDALLAGARALRTS